MCCGVELHDKLIILVGELPSNIISNSTSNKAFLHSRIVLFIVLDVGPVDPPHVTNYGLLVQQNGLIKVMLFLCMEPVVNSSSSS